MATLLELAQMSSASYNPAATGSWLTLDHDYWMIVDQFSNPDTHYYGVAYRNTRTGEIVIANRGTEPSSYKDLWSDLQLAAQQGFDAQDDAIKFAKKIAEKYQGATIIETGHSLGGNEAAAGYAELCRQHIPNVSAVTFQAPGISSKTASGAGNDVLNIYNQGDLIRLSGGEHLGTSISIDAGPSTIATLAGALVAGTLAGRLAAALFGGKLVLLDAHSVDTTVDYLKAHPTLGSMTHGQYRGLSGTIASTNILGYRYDDTNEVLDVTRPDGFSQTISALPSPSGSIVSEAITTSNGGSLNDSHTFDQDSNLTSQTISKIDPDTGMTYDASVNYFNGKVSDKETTVLSDRFGEIHSVLHNQEDGSLKDTSFTYASEAQGKVAYAYDAASNVARHRMKALYTKAVAITVLAVIGTMSPCHASDNPLFNFFKSDVSGAAKMSDVAVMYAEIKDTINVNGLDFSPDGKHLATSSYAQSNEVHVWDWEAKKLVLKLEAEGGASETISEGIRYSPDGHFLAACHHRGTQRHVIHVFDAKTGQLIKEINDPIPGGCEAVAFTPDSQLMLRIARRGPTPGDNLIAYSTKTWEPSWGLVTEPLAPIAMAISPDGKHVAVGGIYFGSDNPRQPMMVIIDLQNRRITKSIAAFPLKNEIKRLAWSPDGSQIAAGVVVGGTSLGPDIVKLFDARTGEQINAESVQASAYISALRYSPDGKYLAEAHINHKIRIWDGQHKTLLQEIPIDDHGLNIAFSRDSRFMAVTDGGTKIQIWKLK